MIEMDEEVLKNMCAKGSILSIDLKDLFEDIDEMDIKFVNVELKEDDC